MKHQQNFVNPINPLSNWTLLSVFFLNFHPLMDAGKTLEAVEGRHFQGNYSSLDT